MCTVFLIISGYGINESFSKNGINSYWNKRFVIVILPTLLMTFLYTILYENDSLRESCKLILYRKNTFWFVHCIIKWYLIFWISTYLPKKIQMLFMLLCAIISLNININNIHIDAEQSFSFITGILISRKKTSIFDNISLRKSKLLCIAFFLIGLFLYAMKLIPQIYSLKGTILYNYLQCPFRIFWALSFILFFSFMKAIPLNGIFAKAGKYSLELYISHIPFIFDLNRTHDVVTFTLRSLIFFSVLLLFKKLLQSRMNIKIAIYIFINTLFVFKYSERISHDYYITITLIYITVLSLFMTYGMTYFISRNKALKITTFASIALFVLMIGLQYYIDPYSIQVDRWSALHFPIENLLNGKYPYSANTHLGGFASPFPVWQIFHIPFYLLGNVGLSFFLTIALLVYSIYRNMGKKQAAISLILLTISPSVWYESAVRSDLLPNMLLLAACILPIAKRLNISFLEKKVVCIAVVTGIFASTRLTTLLPLFILLFPYYTKLSWKGKITLPLVFLCVFFITFMPFALWDWDMFFHHKYNPWTLQTRQGSALDFLVFIPLALYLSFTWNKNISNYCKNTAIMLTFFICFTCMRQFISIDCYTIIGNTFDITYFSMAIPFVILAITDSEKTYNRTH